jgi:hypothetical protein
MLILARLAGAVMVASLILSSLAARADGREELMACQIMIDRAGPARNAGAASSRQDDAKLQRCRQIVRDWTLRDSRMSVDEQGRPLR